jgi:hypothetical protein
MTVLLGRGFDGKTSANKQLFLRQIATDCDSEICCSASIDDIVELIPGCLSALQFAR